MIRTILLAATGILFLGACAATPDSSAPIAAAPAPAAAPVVAVAPEPAPQAAAEPTEAPKAPGGVVSKAAYEPPPGYKTKQRKGETVYCRTRASLGTRVASEECFTQAELAEVENAMRTRRQDIEQRGRMCPSGQMCTGG